MRIDERDVEAYLRTRVEAQGGMCVKFAPDCKAGMPDRIVLLPGGVVVWVELKRPVGGRVSLIQRARHKQLRELGQRVEVVWTREQADALVREYRPQSRE